MRCGVLHRWLVMPLAAAVLYGGTLALASDATVTAPAPPPPPLGEPVPIGPGPDPIVGRPVPPRESPSPPVMPAGEKASHLALLLPLESKVFRRHAEAVRDGFTTAAKAQGGSLLPVRIYALGDDPRHAASAYVGALQAGARVVVGPLTRNAVNAIVGSEAVKVPTLLLNTPEARTNLPVDAYVYSLQIEAEVRQVAARVFNEGSRRVLLVTGETALLRRVRQAFVDAFARLGGVEAIEHAFSTDPEQLAKIKLAVETGAVDAAFLALDFARARRARPYLGSLPVYATSLVHTGDAGTLAAYDLSEVRFLDMPWLLQPDHPAVMAYARPDYRGNMEIDRFYAFGIDAFRIAMSLVTGNTNVEIDGVTGRLMLGRDHYYQRSLTAAHFAEGRVTAPRERRP